MINRIKEHLLAVSLSRKILAGFWVVIFINLVLFIVIFILYANLLTNMAVKNSSISMRIASQGIKSILNDAVKLSNSIAYNEKFKNIITIPPDDPEYPQKVDSVKKELFYIPSYYPHIMGLNLIGKNGTVIQSSSDNYNSSFSESYWFQHIINLDKPTWYRCDVGSLISNDGIDDPIIYLCVPIPDETGKGIGAVIVDLPIKTIQSIIDDSVEGIGTMYLFNETLTIAPDDSSIVTDDAYLKRVNSNLMRDFVNVHEEKAMIFVTEEVGIDGWKMAGIIDKRILLKPTNIIRFASFVSFFLLIVISLVFAFIISKTVTHPISELIKLMKKVENGNLQVKMDIRSKDEVGELGRSFNIMVKRIKYLVTSIYDDQIRLRKAELTALQAQINPHFLYNTLESINWLARYKKNDQIIKMISSLTILFRTSINRGGNIVKVSEEIAHIKSYLTIQHMRYPNSFDYEINIEEGILQYYTVKLIIQPIVENAIYHGVKMLDKKGMITLTGKESNDNILFIIEDNGPGMDESIVNLFNSKQLEKLNRSDSSGYGLKNVDDRIKIFFGKEYGLHFSSVLGKGTKVVVQLPKRKDRKVYDQSYSYR